MVTWGKFFDEGNKIIMPVTIQVHHAVADGCHCSLFFSDVKEISLNSEHLVNGKLNSKLLSKLNEQFFIK